MNRINLIVGLLFFLIASPLNSVELMFEKHDTQEKIDLEFDNIIRNAQDQQFTIVNSTPAPTDLKSGEQIWYSTGSTNLTVYLRNGTSLFVLTPAFRQ